MLDLENQPKWSAHLKSWKNETSLNTGEKDAQLEIQLEGVWKAPAWSPPLHSVHGNLEILFYGLLYNEIEIGSTLGFSRVTPSSTTSILEAGYRRWGRDLFVRLRGEFCVIIVDNKEKRLLCARDHLGVMPVFYTTLEGEGFVVSSSYDGLQLHSRVSLAPNQSMLAAWLTGGGAQKKRETYFKDIIRLPAGSCIQKNEKCIDEFRYWRPEENAEFSIQPEEEARLLFEELLTQAVSRCIGSCQKPGIFLSGGLDSVTVAAFANDELKRLGRESLNAYSLVFPHPDCNESVIQKQIGESLGLKHTFFDFDKAVGSAGLLNASFELSKSLPVPVDNIWLGAYAVLYNDAACNGCDVILTGGGGDEWLNVSPFICADYCKHLDLKGLYHFCNTQQRSGRMKRSRFLKNALWNFGLRPLIGRSLITPLSKKFSSIERFRDNRRRKIASRTLASWLRSTNFPSQPEQEEDTTSKMFNGKYSFYFEEIARSLDHALVSMEKEERYLIGRRYQLKIREPFYDTDLVAMLYNTSPKVLMASGRSKALIRQLMNARFSNTGFANQKKVLSTDFWCETIYEQAGKHLNSEKDFEQLSRLKIINTNRLADVLSPSGAAAQFNKYKRAYTAWQSLNWEKWLGRT